LTFFGVAYNSQNENMTPNFSAQTDANRTKDVEQVDGTSSDLQHALDGFCRADANLFGDFDLVAVAFARRRSRSGLVF
jgi:hypothetical protein